MDMNLPRRQLSLRQKRSLSFLALMFMMSVCLVLATTLATTLFLSLAGAASLPLFFIVFALVSTPVSGFMTVALERTTTLKLFGWCWLSLAILALLGWVLGIHDQTSAFLFYLAISLVELLLGSLGALLLGQYFSITESKRLAGQMSVSLALGGLMGALIVSLMAIWLSPAASLWMISLLTLPGLLLLIFYQRTQKPLNIHTEDDDASHQDPVGSLKFLVDCFREHPLARWLSLGVVIAVLVQCLQEILAFSIYEHYFSDPSELAIFLGIAVALLHLSSLVLAGLVTSRLLPKAGIQLTHLFHPIFNLLSFAAIALGGRLWAAVFAHIASDPLDASVNSPVTTLLYNALPQQRQGRLRLLNDGMIYPLSLGLAGILLLLIEPHLSWLALAALGLVLSFVLLGIHWKAGHWYRHNIQQQAAEGQMNLTRRSSTDPLDQGFRPTSAQLQHLFKALRHPIKSEVAAIKLASIQPRVLGKVLHSILPKFRYYPLAAQIQLVRQLLLHQPQFRPILFDWFRVHWEEPLARIYPLTSSLTLLPPAQSSIAELVIENQRYQARKLLLELLRPLDPKDQLQGVETRLDAGDERQQAQALESLSLLPERHLSKRLAPLFEPLLEPSLLQIFWPSNKQLYRLIRELEESSDPWIELFIRSRSTFTAQPLAYPRRPLMQRLELLKQIPLFAQLSLDDLRLLDAQLQPRHLKHEEILFVEGDAGDSLYILVTGEIEISRLNDEGEAEVLAYLEAGQPVGEMSLLDDQPRSATACATQPTELLKLDRLRFHSLVMQRPQILLGMCRVLAARLRQ